MALDKLSMLLDILDKPLIDANTDSLLSILMSQYLDKLQYCNTNNKELYDIMLSPDSIHFYKESDHAYLNRLVEEREKTGKVITSQARGMLKLVWYPNGQKDIYFLIKDYPAENWYGKSIVFKFDKKENITQYWKKQSNLQSSIITKLIDNKLVVATLCTKATQGLTFRIAID